MESENRKTSGIAFKLIPALIAVWLIAAGFFFYRINQEKNEVSSRIQVLEQEKDEVLKAKESMDASIAEKQAKLEELNHLDTVLENRKQEYYSTCKKLEEQVLHGSSEQKIAYLTFDDGPYVKTTGRYLDVLKEKDVQATFFQLGRTSEGMDELYHRVYDEGHTIANHTYSHRIKNGIYRGVDYFIADVVKNREFIQNKLGITTNILRFPGGSNTAKRLGDGVFGELKKLGYGWIDWNIATGDGVAMMTPDEYRDNVLNHTNNRKVLVVLMHDYSGNTLAALPEIIDGLRSQGYTLLPLFYESEMVNKPE